MIHNSMAYRQLNGVLRSRLRTAPCARVTHVILSFLEGTSASQPLFYCPKRFTLSAYRRITKGKTSCFHIRMKFLFHARYQICLLDVGFHRLVCRALSTAAPVSFSAVHAAELFGQSWSASRKNQDIVLIFSKFYGSGSARKMRYIVVRSIA